MVFRGVNIVSIYTSITQLLSSNPSFALLYIFSCFIKCDHSKLVYNMLGYCEHEVRYPLMDGTVIHSDSIASLIKKIKRHQKIHKLSIQQEQSREKTNNQQETSCIGCKEKVYYLPCGLGPGRQPGWLPCRQQWVLAGERRNGRRSGRARGRAERDNPRCRRSLGSHHRCRPPMTPNPSSARHSETTSVT
jgi:hypothetical protein